MTLPAYLRLAPVPIIDPRRNARAARDQQRSFMRQIEIFHLGETGAVEIADLLGMARLRLADDPLGADIVEENEVHQRRQPSRDRGPPAKCIFPDRHVPAPIVVARVIVRADPVLLGPIDLEITERHAVGATDQRQDMRISSSLFEITVMPGEITTVLPYDIDARIVHPAMIEPRSRSTSTTRNDRTWPSHRMKRA